MFIELTEVIEEFPPGYKFQQKLYIIILELLNFIILVNLSGQ